MIPGIVAQQERMNAVEAGAGFAVLSSNYRNLNAALANDRKSATSMSSGFRVVSPGNAKNSGIYYFEVTLVEFGSSNGEIIVGMGTWAASLESYLGANTKSIGYAWDNRVIYGNGNQTGTKPGSYGEGDVIGVEINCSTKTVRFRKNGGSWSAAFAQMGAETQPVMPLIQIYYTGAQVTCNFGTDPWHTNPEPGVGGWTTDEPIAARYWRYVKIGGPVTPGLNHVIEWEMHEALGGADVTGSGTASASSSFSGATLPANAFDNDTATYWGTVFNSTLPQYLQYDFGDGNDKLVLESRISMRADTNEGYPSDFRILYSHDGTTFFPAAGQGGVVWPRADVRTIYNFDVASTAPPPVIVPNDPFWLNTILSVEFDGVNGTTTYTDDSRLANSMANFNDASIQQGALYLDGVNDGVTVDLTNSSGSGQWTPGSAFTWEFFGINFSSKANDQILAAHYTGVTGSQDWRIMWDQSEGKINLESMSGATLVISASAAFDPIVGVEYDIMVSWDGAKARFYVDGVYIGGTNFSGPFNYTGIGLRIGYDRGSSGNDRNFFHGFMKAVRLTRAARTTSETTYQRHTNPLPVTQTTTTDSLRDKRRLILYGEGADGSQKFIDRSPYDTYLVPAGAVENDTGLSVNGTPSILFGNSNSNHIDRPQRIKNQFATVGADFCFEAYIQLSVVGANTRTILQKRAASSVDFWWYVDTAGKLTFGLYSSGTQRLLLVGATTLAIDTTYHVCVLRKSGVTYMFINGVLDGSGTQSAGETQSENPLTIGYDATNGSRYLRGSLNWLRVTIGDPVYSESGFTPPSVPYLIS